MYQGHSITSTKPYRPDPEMKQLKHKHKHKTHAKMSKYLGQRKVVVNSRL